MGTDRELGASQHYGRIEFAYHLMARQAGIDMAPCRLLEENGRAHFMTRRFDRDGNRKHHQQTLCAIAHLDYKQRATHDYSQLFLTIRQLGLDHAALEEAFRRMAFNVMAANCDDHGKNVSFLLREGAGWSLAPAYDLTHAHNPNGEWTYQHLTGVNGKFSGITRDDLLTVADRFGIGTARRMLQSARDAVAAWPEFARAAGLDATEIERVRAHHLLL
jgi:serine/threonine-protein kinase HipA